MVSAYVGRAIPCGRAGSVPCNAYGRQLGRATLPGGSWTDCHDALGGELFSIMHKSGITMELEPRSIFNTLIPTAALLARGGRPAIVPDASSHVALPAVIAGPVAACRRKAAFLTCLHVGWDATWHLGFSSATADAWTGRCSGAGRLGC